LRPGSQAANGKPPEKNLAFFRQVCYNKVKCPPGFPGKGSDFTMKMILAIVSNDDSANVSRQLTREQYSVTRLATTGGFLMSGNTTLLIGVEDGKVDNVIEIISANSRKRTKMVPSTASFSAGMYAGMPVQVTVGGATIFVMNVERFEKV
jgi:uncharacterized protein YaaQ